MYVRDKRLIRWVSITLYLPRARLTGCSCRSPLAHFYIHHAESSIRELHPFTTITHLATQNAATHPADDDLPIQFLFRKQGKYTPADDPEKMEAPTTLLRHMLRGKRQRVQSVQWTAKLAILADQSPSSDPPQRKEQGENVGEEKFTTISRESNNIALRLEGPYFSPADPHRYDTVVCMVAGTGISGALAISSAFNHASSTKLAASAPQNRQPRLWSRCTIIWSVKESEDITLPVDFSREGLELRRFLTGKGRDRVNLESELNDAAQQTPVTIKEEESGHRVWVYISGPKPFITAGKDACKTVQAQMASREGRWTGTETLDFYAASWDP